MLYLLCVFAALHEFIQEDPRARYDVICAWLYQEYLLTETNGEEFNHDMSAYNECLQGILEGLQNRLDPKDK